MLPISVIFNKKNFFVLKIYAEAAGPYLPESGVQPTRNRSAPGCSSQKKSGKNFLNTARISKSVRTAD